MNTPYISGAGPLFQVLLKEQAPLSLKVGEVIRGQVVEVHSDQSVSIRLKNEVVQAKSAVVLQKGMSVLFQVESLENEIKLKVLGGGVEEVNSLKNAIFSALTNLKAPRLNAEEMKLFFSLTQKIQGFLKGSNQSLPDLTRFFSDIEDLNTDTLKDLIASSGIFFEAKLKTLTLKLVPEEPVSAVLRQKIDQLVDNDLKGALLKLKQGLDQPEVAEALKGKFSDMETLKTTVEKLLSRIEQQQLLSKIDATFQPFVPLIWKELKEGKFILKESYRDATSERDYAVAIHLDLEKVGKLTVNLMMQNDAFHVRFTTESREFQKIVSGNTQLLEERFSACGLHCAGIVVRHEERVDFNQSPEGEGLHLLV